jgi:4-diphosphocytidyl-2-C-methyl-D-erythritol kinase
MAPARTAVTVRAPAKVNLLLQVGPVRDGYHELMTVFHAVSLFDEVTVAPAEELTIRVTGDPVLPLDAVPLGADNLAARAVRALAAVLGREPAVAISIGKCIPVAGGMAGGSADAAAALLACNHLWGAPLTHSRLLDIAAALGSDVPFPLVGSTAVGTGRGEALTPVEVGGRFHWVFAYARGGLSTPAVYAEYDRLRNGPVRPPHAAPLLLAGLREGDAEAVGAALENDLQAAALTLRPELAGTLAAGREHGALGAIVSGSGPTCAFLARDRDHALDLAAALSATADCSAAGWGYGPVTGAHIITPDQVL